MLLGQAPGPHEGTVGRPFGWTAGKTLFRWLARIGVTESRFRERVYIAAVCRCFPGKTTGGGDRVPSRAEIANCSRWVQAEIGLLEPGLVIPVGKLAIAQVCDAPRLSDVVGKRLEVELHGQRLDAIPLPHPSGASTWFRSDPGKALLEQALDLLAGHPLFRRDVLDRREP